MEVKFLKQWYGVFESVTIINKYFSVDSFTINDMMNLFLSNELTLAIGCHFVKNNYDNDDISLLQISGENEEAQKNINIELLCEQEYPKTESFVLDDGFAEVNFITHNDSLSLVAYGYFAISPQESYLSIKSDKYYLHFNEIGFIEYANVNISPESIEIEPTFNLLINDYDLNHVSIELSSVFIHDKELLTLISILENRNRRSIEFIEVQVGRNKNHNSTARTQTALHEQSEYEADLPKRTDADKLGDFVDMLLELGQIRNAQGAPPTYSELHTILTHKFRNKSIPSKNTIKKYMNIL